MKLVKKNAGDLPHARPPLERMLRIHQAIQGGRHPNATQLAAHELEVSTKSIHRDLEFMRDRLELAAGV
jgi:predicted DNA-binding transcriptional regulator YafY